MGFGHVPHLEGPGDTAELRQAMQQDEAGGGVAASSSRLPSNAVVAGQAQRLDLGGDPGHVGQSRALEVQDVGAALQFGCDPHREGRC